MTDLDWNDVRIFLALLRGGSVRHAAGSLGMSHSTVSRHLTEMETALNATLFTRSREGLLATAVAEKIETQAERVENEVLRLERKATGQDSMLSGPVRVTTTPMVSQGLIMPHLVDFTRKYPDIELVVQSGYGVADLMRGAADIAIRFQKSPNDNLVGRRLPEFADCIYASPAYIRDHWFKDGKTNATWLGRGTDTHSNRWVRATPFAQAPVCHELPDPADQAQAAISGLGMTVLPCFFADPMPGLARIPDTGVISRRSGWILTHPDLRTTERIRKCVRFLVSAIKRQTPLISGQQSI